ncbi:MAG: DUF6174 domain-containing protein [Acidimicrobiia bacterium]
MATGCTVSGDPHSGTASETTPAVPATHVAPPGSESTQAATSTVPTTPALRVTGPDANGTYAVVAATVDAWRTCWDDTAPSEYQMSVAVAAFALLPASVSHVIDGEAVEAYGSGDDPVTMINVWEGIDRLLSNRPDSIAIEFDPDLCYPTFIGVDEDRAIEDDGMTERILMQPGGRPEGRQVIGSVDHVDYADATDENTTTVVLEDGSSFDVHLADDIWRQCRKDTSGCGALAILDDSGDALYALPLSLNADRTQWHVPTVGVLDIAGDPLVLWEGPVLDRANELDASQCNGSIEIGVATAIGGEILVETVTGVATGYTCW